MGKKHLVVLFFFLVSMSIQAQDRPDRIQMDQLTYQLYLNQDWKQLIKSGEQALEYGYDYYFMRMRLAMAWYKQENYENARKNLLKALDFNPKDPTALYYLYYADLFSGRSGEARRLIEQMPRKKRNDMKLPGELSLSGISVQAGRFTNNSLDELKEGVPAGDFVSSYYMTSMNYLNASAGFNLGYKSGFTLAINRFDTQTLQQVYTGGNLSEFQHNDVQNGTYLRFIYNFPQSWYAGLAYHGVEGQSSVSYYQSDISGQYGFIDRKEIYSQRYVGGFVGKHLNKLDINAHLSVNNFWQGVFYQSGVSLTYYPFGNINYYLNAGYDRMSPSDQTKQPEEVWKVLAGIKLAKGLYFEGSHIFGNLSNWSDASGFYLFNTRYPIRSRTGVSLVLPDLVPHLQLSFSGFYQNRDHYANIYYDDGTVEPVLQNFTSISFFGGISWVF
ncbi:MAG: tetratricopeptide repeat protein [Bacteroidota bacterium]|nr:tetratricopeptide repeat protein [Bacteroidota bacterium]